MSQTNPYEVPSSNLDQPSAASSRPLNPNWEIGAVLSEAWALSNGFKASFWGAFLLYMGVAMLLGIAAGILTGVMASISPSSSVVMAVLLQFVQLIITAPLTAGLFMISIKRAQGLPVNAFMIFSYFPKTLPLFLTYLLVMLFVVIGLVLLVIPGIYLIVAYALALPLLVDKNLSIWQALETSRKGISACWFRFFGLGLLSVLIMMISAIPLGIGLIWTLPWLYIALGVVYRDLFGVSST
ncbi:hypothetical protein [Cellvibrio sp. OA-2007]|uniref:hypothetical protein n=1 Tax=Cellvibrio sp. OA-2007 TaxID=529823 RepID=UPI000781512A|nr:hypothetical protein [Cellvibrio sp. OA-2007]